MATVGSSARRESSRVCAQANDCLTRSWDDRKFCSGSETSSKGPADNWESIEGIEVEEGIGGIVQGKL